jgi:hypothetical protein
MIGMAVRLKDRLRELKDARSAVATGNAVMVVKGNIVTERYAKYLRDAGVVLQNGRMGRWFNGSRSAMEAGQAAGGRVDLGGAKVGGTGQLSISR